MILYTGDLSPYSAKVRMQIYAMGISDIEFDLPASELAFYNEAVASWEVEAITYSVEIGPCADPKQLLTATFSVTAEGPTTASSEK